MSKTIGQRIRELREQKGLMKRNPLKPNSIGYRIKELRQKKDLTQAELARLVGCGQNTVAEWERGKDRGPCKRLLGKVAQVLGVSIDYLLGQGEIKTPRIPCYGEIFSKEFIWGNTPETYYIEVPPNEYSPNRFSFKILDDLLEPIVCKGDYGIFEKLPPEDGNIVAIRFPENQDKAVIRRWRQQGNAVMFSEVNPHKICSPCFFEIVQPIENLTYPIKNHPTKYIIVEGKLVAVKCVIKSIQFSSEISYIFS